jgi:hypothetical protein
MMHVAELNKVRLQLAREAGVFLADVASAGFSL